MVYPLLTAAGPRARQATRQNTANVHPPVPFHSLSATLPDGNNLSFESLRGKKVLLVNTASNCGYTAQYAELQKLYDRYRNNLLIVAFPANDFKEQEKGSDEEIAAFCSRNYGVTFPVVRKSIVLKGAGQHPVFGWLTHRERNGWNDAPPAWNFAKYLVNEAGVLTHCFAPGLSPLNKAVVNALR